MKILIGVNDHLAVAEFATAEDLVFFVSKLTEFVNKCSNLIVRDWINVFLSEDFEDQFLVRDETFKSLINCLSSPSSFCNPQQKTLLIKFRNSNKFIRASTSRDEWSDGSNTGRVYNYLDYLPANLKSAPFLSLISISSFFSQEKMLLKNSVSEVEVLNFDRDNFMELLSKIDFEFSFDPKLLVLPRNNQTILRDKDRYKYRQDISKKNPGKAIFYDTHQKVFIHLDPFHTKPNQFEVYNARGIHIDVWDTEGVPINAQGPAPVKGRFINI
jgi:hypothetical protein